jgi:S-methyl-5-thioribose-1-phosphate isomerase
MLVNGTHYRTVWMEGPAVKMINQPLLPHRFEIAEFKDHKATAEAVKTMIVRGAGAIGATAGFAMAQAFLEAPAADLDDYVKKAAETLRGTRPTAQNPFYAIDRVLSAVEKESTTEGKRKAAVSEAQKVADEDVESCRKIGEIGQALVKDGSNISTHCNAGWLAFVDWGSALSPLFAAKRNNKNIFVYVDETRPRCQGSRLSAWELAQENIPHAVIADNATGHYMKDGKIDLVIVGADRIAANGDVANKIGTYTSAVLAKENGIPFYVAAPTSTIDFNTKTGSDIPIEERHPEEVTHMFGMGEDGSHTRIRITPEQSSAKNPAFDVTPARYITGIITEKGIVKASEEGLRQIRNDS